MRLPARWRGRPVRVAAGLLVVATVFAVGVSTGHAVPPPPPNPSDSEIADAGAQVDAGVGEVGALINQVASIEQQLRHLDDAVAARREAVNKALVDLQQARAVADAAAAAVATSKQELSEAGTRVDAAHREFNKFVAQIYMRPGSTSLVTYLSAPDPETALARAQVLTIASKNQRQVVDGLRRAQVDQANKNAEARRAQQIADAAAADAERKKVEAENAVAAAQAELNQQTAVRNGLVTQRDSAQQRLDDARARVEGLQSQRDAFLAWDQQRRAEEAAVRAAAAAAAARVAADRAAAERAAGAATTHRPHTQLGDSPPPQRSGTLPGIPSGSRAELIETVVDRAMSQIGVDYAWGGGNENGPTLGIRDGGVADSYGDYNKVGFDCSGLMIYAFAGVGVSLPHYSGYQYNMGTRVNVSDRERGDMLFWGPGGSQHVALYLGGGKMVEAPQSGDVVRVSPVREEGIMPYAVRIV
ncbi:Peptidoglycan endopeptidase RipA precursor [Nocardia otitidiscaviarum]|uniref:Peptidoglycan endopeptidase RipA n=2 Tax=Nocardia otitidiscaviarum TaxID=1823 RepID=A0A379JLF3_9NOCA|nr:NlpC/P60 family protein [Nocardia otitidiscaviarum]SUD49348.1 Peptidoglycan endopeptidase RipA precursor [Nocardia otitidiscaviarum]